MVRLQKVSAKLEEQLDPFARIFGCDGVHLFAISATCPGAVRDV